MSKKIAQTLIPLLDLTNLNDTDGADAIIELCAKAQTPYGNTAAVCVYPQFVKLAKTQLRDTAIKVATVSNFPAGGDDKAATIIEIKQAILDGADEIDVVMPYQAFLRGEIKEVADFISACKIACANTTLKVILETSALLDVDIINAASVCVLEAGADFIKTSTGKHPAGGATLAAAQTMLLALEATQSDAGFKAAGGIRTLEQATDYLELATEILGENWITPDTFRIGASSLLDELLNVLQS